PTPVRAASPSTSRTTATGRRSDTASRPRASTRPGDRDEALRCASASRLRPEPGRDLDGPPELAFPRPGLPLVDPSRGRPAHGPADPESRLRHRSVRAPSLGGRSDLPERARAQAALLRPDRRSARDLLLLQERQALGAPGLPASATEPP